jgi:two-component system phosphate regulon response regulator PhoB
MILVIEDDDSALYALTRTLTYRGYAAIAASSGAEALDILQSSRPRAIVLDWKLPGARTGLDTLREIRANRANASVPVLVYSAYMDDGVNQEAMANGATECIAKGDSNEDALISTLARYTEPHPRF